MKSRIISALTSMILCLLPALHIVEREGQEPMAPAQKTAFREKLTMPYAYLLPEGHTLVAKLQRHGIEVEELHKDIELESRWVNAGTFVVRTNQELGELAANLLEAPLDDGPASWSQFFHRRERQRLTVKRLEAKTPMLLATARSLVENRVPRAELTLDMLDKGQMPNFDGEPVKVRWLEDSEHFLQIKDRQLWKVHAVSGRSEAYSPGSGQDVIMMELAALTESGIEQTSPDQPPFVEAGDTRHGPAGPDSYHSMTSAQKGGDKGKDPTGRELASTDPKGKFNAFVRKNNLYVEEIATKKERALTSDGSSAIHNGKSDWVYYEEVQGRKSGYKHYWWSPDGTHIAFVRLDDGPVPRATVIDYSKPSQSIELTHYPRAGEPNPRVKLAIAPVNGGAVRWVDLDDYAGDESFLITRIGWLPDSKSIYFCVQDRCQTWLDFRMVGLEAGKSKKVLRDTTKAWVDVPLPPIFLNDGSILLTSERTGWKHLFRYAGDGRLIKQLTSGDWDVRSVQRIDEKEGLVFFSGTKDNPNAVNAYSIKLDGTGLKRLTMGKGDNQALFSPNGQMFVNTTSDPETAPHVSLHRADGTLIRILDTNPVYVQEKLKMGEYKRVQIPTPDGFLLEASIQKPANFDAAKKYPVWFMTYGGPRSPTLQGGGGRKKGGGDQALANAGYIVFRCDPRSASNKGANSAWACYKQLGVSELKDVETAIRWLTANPWADAKRVGMSGHSFGGFLTAYCMCNSKVFAAGVASAPPTDWHNYDSIYTDRYMLTPAQNPQGYNATSVVKSAKNLHGRLLLAHGLKDDNVHVQNTFQLVSALHTAGKDFDIMIYPNARHGGYGGTFAQLQREFMKKHLRPEP